MNIPLPTKISSKLKSLLGSKKIRYQIAAFVDLLLIILIVINAKQPAQRLIAPIVSSLKTYSYQQKQIKESFAFVPGLAQNKFSHIDLEGLNYLSFFDVSLTKDGRINLDSKGFTSSELFEKARFQNIKLLLTLSSFSKDTIRDLLLSLESQERLADQATELIRTYNIDGITVDFEYPYGEGLDYQSKFTNFIAFFTKRVHYSLPQAYVAVAIPSSLANNQSIYNLEGLYKASDRIFVIASDFIVPESKGRKQINPVYGFEESEYWPSMDNLISNLSKKVLYDKLVFERAWYGNGNKYPLYIPNTKLVFEEQKEPAHVFLDQETVERLVTGVPRKGREAARRNIPVIGRALEAEGILDSNVLAYALATVEHETDETFEPIEEIQGRISARRLGYEGGANYFGRGFIQITHLRNYKVIGERIGLGDELVKHPELATTPEIAARILAAFFKDNNVANLASQGNYIAARRPVNPDLNAYSIAYLAYKYEIY